MKWFVFLWLFLGWTSALLPMGIQVGEEVDPDSAVTETHLLPVHIDLSLSDIQDSTAQSQSPDTTSNVSDLTSTVQPFRWSTIEKKEYDFPMGAISFADTIILYDPGAMGRGTGDEPDLAFQTPELALGPPDCQTVGDTQFASLGRGGFIIFKFVDNVLIDEPGSDLVIFEADSNPEDFFVWISHDGSIFLPLGNVKSHQPDIDIHSVSEPGAVYPYVRIRDDPNQGDSDGFSVGVDIDAVGAISSAIRREIQTDQLFNEKTANLSAQASDILAPIAQTIRQTISATVSIEAHTDSWGVDDFNLILSQEQADAVRNYFWNAEDLREVDYTVIGWGETQPIASNETESGRYQNRRLEILIRINRDDSYSNERPYD
ncbi:OmpA family protein [bacterium]|nr:OmpA family protein [bacterium]